MARYFGAPRHKVQSKLQECACGNGTFDFSGICSVCHVEAKVLGIHPKAIHKIINRGELKAEKVGGIWLIHRNTLMDFAKHYKTLFKGQKPKAGRPKRDSKKQKPPPGQVWV